MCQPLVAEDASSRIKSLRDPTKKMSKSDPDAKSCVMITDTPEIIVEKVKKAITDFKSEVTHEPEIRAGVTNLLTIHSMVSGKSIQQICDEATDLDTGRCVKLLHENLIFLINLFSDTNSLSPMH